MRFAYARVIPRNGATFDTCEFPAEGISHFLDYIFKTYGEDTKVSIEVGETHDPDDIHETLCLWYASAIQ